jgi:hypothetical protein
MIKSILLSLSCYWVCQINAYAQAEPYRIIGQDVWHFWEALDSLHNGVDTTQVFQRLVIDRASLNDDDPQLFGQRGI